MAAIKNRDVHNCFSGISVPKERHFGNGTFSGNNPDCCRSILNEKGEYVVFRLKDGVIPALDRTDIGDSHPVHDGETWIHEDEIRYIRTDVLITIFGADYKDKSFEQLMEEYQKVGNEDAGWEAQVDAIEKAYLDKRSELNRNYAQIVKEADKARDAILNPARDARDLARKQSDADRKAALEKLGTRPAAQRNFLAALLRQRLNTALGAK